MMLPFQWNALRTGDRVLVHDDQALDAPAQDGAVSIVQAHRGSDNDIAIRIDATGTLVRPRRHAVHQLPLDLRVSCWRCDLAAQSAQVKRVLA